MKEEKGRKEAGKGFIYSAGRLTAPFNSFGKTDVRGTSTMFYLTRCF